jgi:diguanylate cyclase (GGDEF)-like protein
MLELNSLHRLKGLRRTMLAIALAWIIGVSASLAWNLYQRSEAVKEHARLLALASFQKDVLYRRWNAGHSGVYVPVTDKTQPNPYLADNPNRDLIGSNDRLYTLINPAYMTRQVFELQQENMGVWGHITSLNPIRPQNKADAWETQALQAFEQGVEEVSSIEMVNGQPALRFMRPLYVEEGCLKCHARQGYQIGQVRGGISETVPIKPLQGASWGFSQSLLIGHSLIALAGLLGITFATRRLQKGVQIQVETEQKLLHMSTHDALTGLYNRTYFEDTLQRIESLQVKPVSVIVVDIDDLKKVNDTWGHEAGDRLIQVSGEILHQSFRSQDTISRVGGDEFIIILPATNDIQAKAAFNRLQDNVNRYNSQQPIPTISLSIGMATSLAGVPLSETLKLADRSMYEKKEAKKRQSPASTAQ